MRLSAQIGHFSASSAMKFSEVQTKYLNRQFKKIAKPTAMHFRFLAAQLKSEPSDVETFFLKKQALASKVTVDLEDITRVHFIDPNISWGINLYDILGKKRMKKPYKNMKSVRRRFEFEIDNAERDTEVIGDPAGPSAGDEVKVVGDPGLSAPPPSTS